MLPDWVSNPGPLTYESGALPIRKDLFWWFRKLMLRSCPFVCLCFWPGPEVIKLFTSSTQRSMKFFLLINVKMPTIVGILTFMNR